MEGVVGGLGWSLGRKTNGVVGGFVGGNRLVVGVFTIDDMHRHV